MQELIPVIQALCEDYCASLSFLYTGEHQMELLDCVAAKFHEEPGVFKLMVASLLYL